jgi:hypothetical protein
VRSGIGSAVYRELMERVILWCRSHAACSVVQTRLGGSREGIIEVLPGGVWGKLQSPYGLLPFPLACYLFSDLLHYYFS